MMQAGDIYLVEIPPSGGREQAGLRPAIIAQTVDPERLPTILIIPFTSKVRAADFPSNIALRTMGVSPWVKALQPKAGK